MNNDFFHFSSEGTPMETYGFHFRLPARHVLNLCDNLTPDLFPEPI